MGLFGKAKPQRIVVKEYGHDSFLGLLNPLMAFLLLGGQGMKGQLRSQARVIEKAEKDAVEMAKQGTG
jgi:hypothetical protein